MRAVEHFDVVVVGAGISGIDAGYHLQKSCPDRTWVIFEGRDAIGGTWDLFRYPGIRSDSDMHTLGFPFRPWGAEKAIADGPKIRQYVEDTARQFGIDRHIRFRHRVTAARWSSAEARWRIEYEAEEARGEATCSFLYMAAGYYDYRAGYLPDFPERDEFQGRIIHPQQWPENLDYAGKRIVVIGSGATAVTLVPALAKTAGHVTMLQRSPTYIVARPARDPVADWLFKRLPEHTAERLVRLKNVGLGIFFYRLARKQPDRMRRLIMGGVRKALPDLPGLEKHFTPPYNPWDQRLCLAPDGDFFQAIRSGRADVATDRIDRFTARGIRLQSGRELEADIIVTATGLALAMFGNVGLCIDGKPVNPAEHMIYRGMMVSGVPNLVLAFGYTNASWTLKVDLVAQYACRLLNRMRRRGEAICVPREPETGILPRPMLSLTSNYISRSEAGMPKQGSKAPWRLYQNYALDVLDFRFHSLKNDVLEFRRAAGAARA